MAKAVRRVRNFLIGLLVVLYWAYFLRSCSSPPVSQPVSTMPPPVPRQITENTLGLREYWRKSHSCGSDGDDAWPPLVAVDERVACVVWYGYTTPCCSLRVYDATSGNLLWEVAQDDSGDLAADTERVYLIQVGGSHQLLQVYDINTGQRLWKKNLPSHAAYRMRPDGDELYVEVIAVGEYTFDSRTGTGTNPLFPDKKIVADDGFELAVRYPQLDLYELPLIYPERNYTRSG